MIFDPERVFRDLMCESFAQVSAAQWRERARAFRWARPHPDDFPGTLTVEQLRAKWHELTALASACERHAELLEEGATWPEVMEFSIFASDLEAA